MKFFLADIQIFRQFLLRFPTIIFIESEAMKKGQNGSITHVCLQLSVVSSSHEPTSPINQVTVDIFKLYNEKIFYSPCAINKFFANNKYLHKEDLDNKID